MGIEIERKFLVTGDEWRRNVVRQEAMRQGYLSPSGFASGSPSGFASGSPSGFASGSPSGFASSETCSVRVRIQGDAAFLNIKEAVMGRERLEFDYGIPVDDAVDMLEHLRVGPVIEKTRYFVEENGVTWEIDVFHGDNAGLVVAELELESADSAVPQPAWRGREVTDEKRYYNVSLAAHPYARWTNRERQS